jgi:ribonuclease D
MTYLYLDSESSLTNFCQKITNSVTWFAIDTEFMRTNTFYAELSLIQIYTDQDEAAIIDPIAISDLNSLWSLLSNPNIIKVFHSARQDIEILYQIAGQMPVSIFDTQIAALFLGHGDLVGLARVLKAELNIEIAKDQSRTNWNQRPLTKEQLEYAINDVKFLSPLYKKITANLTKKQQDALKEDFSELLNHNLYDDNPTKTNERIKKANQLVPKNHAISNTLAQWREDYAIENNKPRKWTLSDDCILAIAKRPPKTVEDLYKVPNIKSSSVKQFGEKWIALIDEVFANPENWPSKQVVKFNPSEQEQVFMLIGQAINQQLAIDYGLNVNNIVNKQQLLNIIKNNQEKQQIGWRHLLMEQPLQAVLATQKFIKLTDKLEMTSV